MSSAFVCILTFRFFLDTFFFLRLFSFFPFLYNNVHTGFARASSSYMPFFVSFSWPSYCLSLVLYEILQSFNVFFFLFFVLFVRFYIFMLMFSIFIYLLHACCLPYAFRFFLCPPCVANLLIYSFCISIFHSLKFFGPSCIRIHCCLICFWFHSIKLSSFFIVLGLFFLSFLPHIVLSFIFNS